MCGIAGIYSHRPVAPARSIIERMTRALAHRGPDGEGYFLDSRVALGHRRLAIIDIAGGAQPIFNEDKSVVGILNGEIYNYRELRRELQSRGHRFATESDTESVVHAYEQWGIDCLARLDGMFAIALWDRSRQRLLLAVDRIGIKPIVYSQGRELLFASEMTALLQCPEFDAALDPDALAEYFTLGYVPGPSSIYRSVRKLPPGHLLVAENGRAEVKSYWELRPATPERGDPESLTSEVRETIRREVRSHLVSDVPIGAFLSGGIDSSIVVSLMRREATAAVKTFSIGFEGQSLLDESSYAREVAAFNLTEHRSFMLSHRDVLDAIGPTLDGLGEPFADYSLIPTAVVSRETRRHVTVALSGDGADELFGGYAKYRGEMLQRYYRVLPRPVRQWLIAPLVHRLPARRTGRATELARQAQRFVDGDADTQVDRHAAWMRIAEPDLVHEILQRDGNRDGVRERVEALYAEAKDYFPEDPINQMLYVDVRNGLPFDMLAKVDLASMQHSLEVRVPFLSRSAVELAFAVPGRFKLGALRGKRILREAFADLLPPRILRRRKQGFDLPVGEWLKREMHDTFRDVALARRTRTSDLLNLAAVERLHNLHCAGVRDFTKFLWAIFVFQWWGRRRSVCVA